MMKLFVVILAAAILTGGGASFAGTKKYTYDAAGRLVRVDYGNGKGFVYRYDANGNLLSRQPLSAQPPGRQRPAKPGGAAKQETSNDARPAAP
jgi:YD repeat-containing protein